MQQENIDECENLNQLTTTIFMQILKINMPVSRVKLRTKPVILYANLEEEKKMSLSSTHDLWITKDCDKTTKLNTTSFISIGNGDGPKLNVNLATNKINLTILNNLNATQLPYQLEIRNTLSWTRNLQLRKKLGRQTLKQYSFQKMMWIEFTMSFNSTLLIVQLVVNLRLII